ncbi:helix-turn-helix domain-containing protein [Aquipuribacter nitratireducens]|uniref:Helix-turn-helix domain-containing protein n=1 Tax=Aquipuribacter nitratireducens TaxID=650104 RepID=A0ABW0GRD7_9MICO
MADDATPRSLASKLDHLFASVRSRGADEPTYREVAAAIADQGGPTISPSYIWQLRTGLKDNPTLKHLQALARYFGVETAYFFDDAAAERIDAELALLTAMRDAGVRSVALRAAGLSPESLGLVRDVIDGARRLEGESRRRGGGRPQPSDDTPGDVSHSDG